MKCSTSTCLSACHARGGFAADSRYTCNCRLHMSLASCFIVPFTQFIDSLENKREVNISLCLTMLIVDFKQFFFKFNPSECKGNFNATSTNMKLVHWPLTGGLLHLVQRGGDWAGPQWPLNNCDYCLMGTLKPQRNGPHRNTVMGGQRGGA